MSGGNAITFGAGRGVAVARATEAMLRSLGGCEVVLRFSADDDSEDVLLSPVIARIGAQRMNGQAEAEFVVGASCVSRVLEQRQAESARELFVSAQGIVFQEQLFRIKSVETQWFAGVPYVHRVATLCPEGQP